MNNNCHTIRQTDFMVNLTGSKHLWMSLIKVAEENYFNFCGFLLHVVCLPSSNSGTKLVTKNECFFWSYIHVPWRLPEKKSQFMGSGFFLSDFELFKIFNAPADEVWL